MQSSFIQKITTERSLVLLSLFVICLVYLPYLILGKNINFPIHDNMDSNIIWAKMVSDAGGIFASPNLIVDQIMDGIHRAGVYGLYDIALVLFDILGPFGGYAACKFLMAIMGFFGTYLLVKKYILFKDSPVYIAIGVGLMFGLLPFWSFTATVAGSPLAVYALLNLRRKEKSISNWLYLLLYAFFSSLILIGVFVLLVFAVIWIIDIFRNKSVNWHLFTGLAFLSLAYILSHFPLFSIFFYDSDFVSVRTSFVNMALPFGKALRSAFEHIVIDDGAGEFWAFTVSLQRFIIIPATIIAAVLLIKNKEKNRHFIYLYLFIILSSFFAAMYIWGRVSFIHEFLAKFIPMNPRRIYWLTPVCWYGLFGLSLCIIVKYLRQKGQVIAIAALILQLGVVIYFQEHNRGENLHSIPYSKFYAEHQFTDVRNFIGKDADSYRVISLGIHPAIPQYNGFYTVDGYSTNYDLAYKLKFRKIIEKELEKSPSTKKEYDDWGSWCYAFFGENGFMQILNNTNDYPRIDHLDYNFEVLKEMGGEYIISAAEINTANNPQLTLLRKFDNYEDSYWKIYLYKVN
ncbi:MAG TPA: hypothetical protein DIT04_12570 [Dysgonomonas sp.]|nr:hypothetical protein [Dysgonomonas sp.]